jgi:signal peptidase I
MKDILKFVLIFLMGFLSCLTVVLVFYDAEKPLRIGEVSLVSPAQSPGNWIKEENIHIYENAVVIDIEGASLSRYAPTGSMKPILDIGSNGIRIVPENPSQISIGDIITFQQNSELVVHRVIDKGADEQGAYFITKGDKNNVTDGRIRFKDIKYVTIAIIY